MEYDTLKVERDGAVMTVTLNRPEKLNAFNLPLVQELARLVGRLEEDSTTRAVIFTGAGRAFSSGADVGELREAPAHLPRSRRGPGSEPGSVATSRLSTRSRSRRLTGSRSARGWPSRWPATFGSRAKPPPSGSPR